MCGLNRDATVGAAGERAVIAALSESARGSAVPGEVVIGSGDDAAVIDTNGPAVISTDTVVEGRHFRLDWSSAEQVGARAVVQSAADVAAMGGRTSGVVVSIGCPGDTTVAVVLDLSDGMIAAAHDLGARVLGGDLVAAEQLVVTVTSIGALDGRRPISLSGGRVGDLVAVSGALGASAAGLAVLSSQRSDRDELVARWAGVVAAHQIPTPDLAQGPVAAAAGAHAMTDVSDGLVAELITMSAASGLTLSVRSTAIPAHPDLAAVATVLDVDPATWLLAGGEDHELLAAFAPATVPDGWTVIGTIESPRGGRPEVLIDGSPHDPDAAGWQSFG